MASSFQRAMAVVAVALSAMAVMAGCDTNAPAADPASGPSAIDPSGSGATDGTRSDSAGVEIVQIAPAALEGLPVWRLSAEPLLSIGELAGEEPYLFARVAGSARLSDGRIVVLDSSAELRFFDADGRFLFRRGREGEGPGEFRQPTVLARGGADTLYVWDAELLRVAVYASDGSFVRTEPGRVCPPDDPFSVGAGCVRAPPHFLDDGTMVAERQAFPGDGSFDTGLLPGRPFPLGLVRDGTWTTVATLHNIDRFSVQRPDVSRPAARIYGTIFGGRPVWHANGDLIAEARTDSSDIRIRSPDGTLRRILRFTGDAVPVTEAVLRRHRESDAGMGARDDGTRDIWLDEAPVAETMPRFGALRLDEAGRLWISDYRPAWAPSEEPRWWTVFSVDGTPLARMAFPSQAYGFHELDEEAILGVSIGRQVGVNRVVLHRIERPDTP